MKQYIWYELRNLFFGVREIGSRQGLKVKWGLEVLCRTESWKAVYPTSRPPEEDDGNGLFHWKREGRGVFFVCIMGQGVGALGLGLTCLLSQIRTERERAWGGLNFHLTVSPPFINVCHRPATLFWLLYRLVSCVTAEDRILCCLNFEFSISVAFRYLTLNFSFSFSFSPLYPN